MVSVYVLVVGLLLLAALAVSVPVLLGIAQEGRERMRERLRERQTGGWERYGEDREYDAGPAVLREEVEEGVPPGMVACPHCGAENERGYAYCRTCTGRL